MSDRFLAVAAIATLGCAGTPAADATPPGARTRQSSRLAGADPCDSR